MGFRVRQIVQAAPEFVICEILVGRFGLRRMLARGLSELCGAARAIDAVMIAARDALDPVADQVARVVECQRRCAVIRRVDADQVALPPPWYGNRASMVSGPP